MVYLTTSAENACSYCVGAHSVLVGMVGMPKEILAELSDQRPLSDPKIDTRRRVSLALMAHRGRVPQQEIAEFQAAGYDQRHLLEVLTIPAQKTLSNYYNHIDHTPLDEMFMSQKWTPKEAESGGAARS